MNLDTVRKCANMAAAMREASLGFVDADIVELLADLDAVDEAVKDVAAEAAKTSTSK